MAAKIENTNSREIVYEPDNSIKDGYFAMIGEILNEIKKNRWLIIQLFKRELLASYKQSFIGIFWALLLPIAGIATFIVLNRSGIFSIGHLDVPYPLYAAWGLTSWQTFSTGLLAASNSLVKAGPMVVKINFSKKSLVMASAGQSLISLTVLTLLSMVLGIHFGHLPTLWVLLLPVLVIPLLSLLTGLGMILALLNGIFRDISNILSVLMTFLLFLTPVLYPLPKEGGLARLSLWNPLYYLIGLPRELILSGTSALWKGFAWSSLFSLMLLLLCIVSFHLTESRVTERI